MEGRITIDGPEFQDEIVRIVSYLPELQKGLDLIVRKEGADSTVIIPYPHRKWGEKYLELEAFLEKTAPMDSRQTKDLPVFRSLPYRECIIGKDRVTFLFSVYFLPESEDEDLYQEAVALARKHQVFRIIDIMQGLSWFPGFNITKKFLDRMIKEGIIHHNEHLDSYVITW